MNRVIRAMTVWAVCGLVLLMGCSGAGVSTSEVQQQPVQSFAADHLAAMVLVRGWVSALRSYPAQDGGCIPEGDFEMTPDGAFHVWGTNSDCSTYDLIDRGGMGEGTWVLADGREVEVGWETLEAGFPISRERIVREFWDGTRMEFVATYEFAEHMIVGREGTLALADGRSMEFSVTQTSRVEETVSLELTDGSACEYRLPLKLEGMDEFVPVNEDGVEGTYTAADGDAYEFSATGDAAGLNRWEITCDGLRGEFTMGDRQTGDGTISRDGRVIAVLNWATPASGTVDLLAAGSAEVGPAGAALDFAVDRWISNAAALGPMPMY